MTATIHAILAFRRLHPGDLSVPHAKLTWLPLRPRSISLISNAFQLAQRAITVTLQTTYVSLAILLARSAQGHLLPALIATQHQLFLSFTMEHAKVVAPPITVQ